MRVNGKLVCKACWKSYTANLGGRCAGCVKEDKPKIKNPRGGLVQVPMPEPMPHKIYTVRR